MIQSGKTQRQVDRDRGLADPALAAHHEDLVFDFAKRPVDGQILLGQTGVAAVAGAALLAAAGTSA